MSPPFHTRYGLVLWIPLAALLAGCPMRIRDSGAPPASKPVAPAQGEGRPYDIAPGESLLTIQVYRSGALARAGHNHVIASHDVTGKVFVNDDVTRSSFHLQFPVASLTVDEPELRGQAGADFPPGVPDSAQEGTRRNLLSEALLDSARFPTIVVSADKISSAADGALTARMQVVVKDQAYFVSAPFRYEVKGGRLLATGELPLKQTDLGLKPFSVMMGALEVKDEMKIRIHIVARPTVP